MNAKAKFLDLEWVPVEGCHLIQGVKGGRTPRNAFGGSNGTFIVPDNNAELNLVVRATDQKVITKNIYGMVKSLGVDRITKTFREKLEMSLRHENFEVENGEIINLDNILLKVI